MKVALAFSVIAGLVYLSNREDSVIEPHQVIEDGEHNHLPINQESPIQPPTLPRPGVAVRQQIPLHSAEQTSSPLALKPFEANPKQRALTSHEVFEQISRDGKQPLDAIRSQRSEIPDRSYGSNSYVGRFIFGAAGYVAWYDQQNLSKAWLQSSAASRGNQKQNYDIALGFESQPEDWKSYHSENGSLNANSIGSDQERMFIEAGNQYQLHVHWIIRPEQTRLFENNRLVAGYVYSADGKKLGAILLREWTINDVEPENSTWPSKSQFQSYMKILKADSQ